MNRISNKFRRAWAAIVALATFVPWLVMSPSPAAALTLNPGVCTSGDICIADGNLSGGSLTVSCRVYGWDASSSENSIGPLSNYSYPGTGTGCSTLNVNNTANSTRNRMDTTQRRACFFDASNGLGTVVFIDVYSSVTWKNMASGSQNRASFIRLYAPGTSGCP